jgi:hypothetical protein
VAEHYPQRGHLVQRRPGPLGDQEEHRAQQGHAKVARQRDGRLPGGQVAEQGDQRVGPVQPGRVPGDRDAAAAPGGGLHVVHDRVGDDPNPEARGVHPPAQVGVLAEQRHRGVEPAGLLPDVAADQHPRAAHREGVVVAVVLALVDLARLDAGDPAAGRVDGHPGLEDDLAVRPVPHLGPEHRRGPGLGRAAEQLLQRVRGGLAVVVQQPQPLDPLAVGDPGRKPDRDGRAAVGGRAGNRGAVTGAPVHPEDDLLAEPLGQDRTAAVPASGVDGDHPLHRPGLAE